MRKYKNWIPAFTVMLVIFLASSVQGTTVQAVGLGPEKYQISGHAIMYFFLCASFYKGVKDAWASVSLTVMYGFLDEFHQFFTYLRSPSFFDIAIDTTAAMLAGLILWKLQANLPKKLKIWLNN